MKSETIVAPATAQGVGAIGVIRLSGDDAIAITQKVWRGKDLTKQASHTIHYGHIMDGDKELDEVMVSIFRAPKSFTTEDVIEISCHGSPYIVEQVIKLLIGKGARMAEHGEFTLRAFMNGRIDLSQAEAVADIIASDSQESLKVALQQMRGGISAKLKELRTSLIDFAALIELELDFAEEDVEFADRTKFKSLLNKLKAELEYLSSSFKYGNALKNGTPVAIIGRPNAGKSTLLNGLLDEERAIVSDIAGTTRDTIEESLTIEGHIFRLIDTAGIRYTTDTIERIGVERSREKIKEAEIILYLYDYNTWTKDEAFVDIKELELPSDKTIILVNKAEEILDREGGGWKEAGFFGSHGYSMLFTAAAERLSVERVKSMLLKKVKESGTNYQNSVVITNNRHYAELIGALAAIDAVLEKINTGISTDLISQDIRTAIRHLGEITGDIEIDRDILGAIFSKFCIGK